MKITEKAAVKLSDYTPTMSVLSTSLASCNPKKLIQAFCSTHLYVAITNCQCHKKRMLMIVIHFKPSRSFFYLEIFC